MFLLSKIYHYIVLGRVTISSLNEIDKTVRGLVRQWLALLNDTLTAYFHAPVAKGGLGIPSLRGMAPLQRWKLLIEMLPHHNISEVKDSNLAREIALCTSSLTCEDGNVIDCLSALKHTWAQLLHNMIEEKPLREFPASMAGLTMVHLLTDDSVTLKSNHTFVVILGGQAPLLATLANPPFFQKNFFNAIDVIF